jgi:hypothetical protein
MVKGNATTQLHSDNKDHLRITHEQDVSGVLKENAELASLHGGNVQLDGPDGAEMKLAARVPMVLLEKWRIEEGLDYHLVGRDPEMTARFWKKLQDPSWQKLRVWDGKLV